MIYEHLVFIWAFGASGKVVLMLSLRGEWKTSMRDVTKIERSKTCQNKKQKKWGGQKAKTTGERERESVGRFPNPLYRELSTKSAHSCLFDTT